MTYNSFESFIESIVIPKKQENPDHIRLDGKTSGGNRNIAGIFQHQNKVWKVHADTHLKPLLSAYELIKSGKIDNPFVEKNTRDGKGKCLVIKDEVPSPLSISQKKYLYIYETTVSKSQVTHFFQYWKYNQVKNDVSIGIKLEHIGSDQFERQKVKPNDMIWIVTIIPLGHLILVGRLEVGKLTDYSQAQSTFGYNVFERNQHIIAKQGTEEEYREINLMDVVDQLRFISKTSDRLQIENNRVDGKQLQTIRKLTPHSISLLESRWYGNTTSEITEIEHQISSGAGFGDPERNKKVEKAAVKFVTEMYENDGWRVVSVEAKKCGYDLLCSKNRIEEHIEVTGVSGTEISFIITVNEVKQAETNPQFAICVVTSALSEKPSFNKFTGEQFIEKFVLEEIAFRAKSSN